MRNASRWAVLALILAATASPGFGQDAGPGGAPQVVLSTTMGEITLELYPDRAPLTVDNFLRYVKAGFYDGTLIHRVIADFMIQGGGYTREMRLKTPLYPPIRLESRTGLKNLRGTVALARSKSPDSATSQFFINVVDNPFLDYNPTTNPTGYAVFGRVVRGMEVVDRIRDVEVEESPVDLLPDGSRARSLPVHPVVILSARLVGPPTGAGE